MGDFASHEAANALSSYHFRTYFYRVYQGTESTPVCLV